MLLDQPPAKNLEFRFDASTVDAAFRRPLLQQLREFRDFRKKTAVDETKACTFDGREIIVPALANEFWTAKQRAANSLHEVSYRACFKPQLPRFFIERLTLPGDFVYDPFMGRGTTLLEAALLSRVPFGCDVNPLSTFLVKPRLNPPELREIENRLSSLDLTSASSQPEELLAFYHPQTLKQICSLKEYLLARTSAAKLESVDEWLRVVALNRLTGHSKGFFSVYTMLPNQAASLISQKKINAKRNQVPPFRNVPLLIGKRSRQLLRDCDQRTRDTLSTVAKSA